MTEKDSVIESIRHLPDHATFNEILEHLTIYAALRRGLEASKAGDVVSHEEVKRRVAQWPHEKILAS